MDKKSPLQSKTIWVNAIVALAGIAAAAGIDYGITTQGAEQTVGAIMTLIGVVNIGLRKVTHTAI